MAISSHKTIKGMLIKISLIAFLWVGINYDMKAQCPTANAGTITSICYGDSFFSTTASATNNTNGVLWSGGAGTWLNATSLTGAEYIPSQNERSNDKFVVLTLTVYADPATCPGGPDATSQINVSIVDPPTIDPFSTINICSGNNAPLNAVITSSYDSVRWETIAGASGTFLNPISPNTFYQHSQTDSINGGADLSIKVYIGNCYTEEFVYVSIAPTPSITNPGNQTACDSYTLPAINGSALSGNEAYYTATGGGGTQYDPGDVITSSTTLYIYDTNGSCSDQESFTITITASPNIANPGNQTACNSYTLPAISGTNLSGGQAYFTGSGGTGSQYNAGDAITSTTTLYIYDTNGSCSDQENFTITITNSPNITNPGPQSACDSYTLPTIAGTNLSGNEAYYTGTGGTGTQYNPGQAITSTTTLFIYDTNGSCSDQENFTITITSSPVLNSPGNQVACDSYVLPAISGTNLSGGQAYYTGSGGTGSQYNAGESISSTTLLYIYDANGSCSDQVSFTVTIVNSPSINSIANQSVCDSYTLPTITGTNLSGNQAYYTGSGGTGTQYNAGQSITSTTTLFIYDSNGTCSDETSFSITVTNTPVVNDITDPIACNSYTLPAITGTNLSGNQGYYTASGGVGVKYVGGQVITSSTTLYIYDSNGSCSSEEVFSITINTTPSINNPGNQSACDSYTLPVITGSNLTGNQAYYTGSGGTGTQYNAGQSITSTVTLFIYDSNGTCSDEESFTIVITNSPSITSISDVTSCDSYTLPTITGTDLSGNEAYYTATNGGGVQYNAGDIISSSTTLYIYDSNGSCSSEGSFNITIVNSPTINGIANQSVCDSYTLPTITGANLSGNEAYYTATNGGGVQYSAGDVISSSTTLYIYDNNGTCSDEETFNITVTITPTVNDITNQIACDSYTLPTITGSNLTGNQAYYTASGGVGTQYLPGDVITSSISLYIFDANGSCSDEEQFTITINATPSINPMSNQIACDSYTLPVITGTNLSGGQAYYTGSNGTGAQYTAGSSITSTTTLYIYDSNGSCSDEENFTITIINSPNIIDPGDQTACNSYTLPAIVGTNLSGNQAYYTASGGGGIRYNIGDVITSNIFLYIYDANGSCSDEESFSITILSPPVVNDIADQTACGSYTLPVITGTNLSGNQGFYTGSGGTGTHYNAGDVINSSDIIFIYDDNGSCSDEESFNVTIIPEPIVNAGAPANICGLTNHTLNGAASNYDNTSIVWTIEVGSGTLINANTLSPTYMPVAADYLNPVILRLSVDGLSPCAGTYYNDIILNYSENVIIDAGPATALICEGQTYTANPSTNTPSTYLWTTNGDGTFDNDQILNATYTPGTNDIATKTVTLTLEATGTGTCSGNSIDEIVLEIQNLPSADAGPAIVNICESDTYFTAAATAADYDVIDWQVIDGTGNIANPNSLTGAEYVPSQDDINNGFAILRLTITSNAPCYTTAIDDIRIEFTNEPGISYTTPPNMCEGVPHVITNVSTTDATSVQWSIVNGSGVLADAATINPSYTPSTADVVNGSVVLRIVASPTSPCTNSTTEDITFPIVGAPTVNIGNDITVCEGTTSIPLTPVTTNGVSYQWTTSGNGTFTPSNTALNVSYIPHNNDYAGGVTITLEVTGDASCGMTVSDDLDITFTPAPTATVNSTASVCEGNSYFISSAAATNYSSILWTHNGNGILTGPNLEKPTYTPSPLDVGSVVTFTMTVSGNGSCADATDQILLSVVREPEANIVTTDAYTCGSSYQITSASANYYNTLTWTTSGDGSFDNPASISPIYTFGANDIANGIVSLTLTASPNAPCASDATDAIIIHLVGGPTANAGPDLSICETQDYTTSTASVADATSVEWSIVSGTGTFTGNTTDLVTTYQPSASDINLGSVTLRLTAYGNAACPVDTDDITITINKEPEIDAGAPANVCLGTTYQVTDAIANNTSSYSWTSNGHGTLTNATTLTPSYQPHIDDINLNGGVVTLTLNGLPNSPCPDNVTSVKVLTILEEPTAFSGNDAYACAGSDYLIQGATATNASDYIWTSSSGGVFINNGTLAPTYRVNSTDAATGYVDITLEAVPISPCATPATHTFRLTVLTGPVSYAGANATICEDGDYVNTDANPTDYTSLLWETSGDGAFSSTTALHPTYSPGSADITNGYVTLTLHAYGNGNNGCNHDFSELNLTINKLPTADAGPMTEICEGSNTITGASATNASGYQWTIISGTGNLLNASSLTPIYITSAGDVAAGTVVLELEALPLDSCGTSATSTLTLNVVDAPTADAGTNATVCRQTPYALSGATSNSLTNTFQWTTSGSGTFSNANDLNPTYTPSAADVLARSVTLTLAASNGSCTTAIDNMVLTIESTQVDAGANASVCINSTYTGNATITGNYGTILWTHNGAGVLTQANTTTPIYTPDATDAGTTITLTITVDEAAPCAGTVSDALSLTIRDLPTATLGADLTICEDENLTVAPGYAIATNYTNIYWTTSGDGVFTFSGSDLQPTYIPGANDLAQGFADLTMHVENTPCVEATDQMRLLFSYLPTVDAGLNATVDVGASYTVTTASVSDASPILWTTSGTGTFTAGSATTISPTYTPSTLDFANGSIILTLTATPVGICTTPVSDYMILTVTDHPPVDFYTLSSCAGTITEFFIDQAVTNMANIASYAWDFGDGNTSSDAEPTHTYVTTGIYSVTLTVTDLLGYTNIVQRDVEVNPVPQPNFTYLQPSCSGLITEFTDQTVAPSGYIVEWIWDFGDGTDTTITFPGNPDINHIYANSGTYQVILSVTSSDSCTNAVIRNVTVTEAPIANYTYSNTCLGNYTTFTDASTITGNNPIISWDWDFGDPASGIYNTSTEQNPGHQFLSEGDYAVSLTITNLNGCTDIFTDTITVTLPPTLDFTDSSGCVDTEIQFTVDTTVTDIASITDWAWDFGDGTTSTDQDPVHIYTQSGTYNVNLTALNLNGCSFTVTHQVEIYVSPVANFDTSEPSCQESLIDFIDYSFTPTGTIITEWRWYFGDGDSTVVVSPNSPDVQHQYSTSGDFMATLRITNSNGCVSEVSKQITILPQPIADFSYTASCSDQPIQFTDQTFLNGAGNIISWNWNFGDQSSGINNTSTLQNPTHLFNSPGDYTVSLQVENAQGCIDTISLPVSVRELPGVDFDIVQACLDTLVEFNLNTAVTNVSEIASYLWEFGDGQTSNEQNPAHQYNVDGTYTITLTVTDTAGCVNSVSHNLSLSPLPISLFGISESQCNSDPIQFTNYSTSEFGYITEWHWDYGDGNDTTITHPGNPNISHLYQQEGTYTVSLTVTNSSGCSHLSTQEVTILPGPVANFDFESVCLNVSANFIDLSQSNEGGRIVSWNWDFGDPNSGVDNFSTLQNPSHIFSQVGSHLVTLTVRNENGCTSTDTSTIIISMLPEIDFSTVGGSCLDGVTEFFIDSNLVDVSSIQSAFWEFGDDATSNATQPSHIYSEPGTYTVSLTIIDLNGCSNSVSKEVYIDQLPDVKFDTDAPSCDGLETQFIDLSSRTNFIVRWHWEFGDGTDTTINWPADQNVAHTYPSDGRYLARLTITTADSCVNTTEKEITIIPAPVANFAATSACIDHPAEFTDLSQENSGGLIVDWYWDFGDPASGINNNSSQQNPVHRYAESGRYEVILTITNAEGCSNTYTDSVDVTIPPPLDPFTFDDIICMNTEAQFFMSTNINLADVQSILWNFGDPTSANNTSSEQNPTHIYETPGEYIVTLTLDNNNCGGSITDTITVNSKPQARFEFENACVGSPTIFTDLSTYSDSPIESWSWDFGIVNLLSDTSSLQNPTYVYRQTGQHYVSLEVTDVTGCSDIMDSVFIEIFPTPIAKFSFVEGEMGTIEFTNESTDATIYEWSFGDGWISDEVNPIHQYDTTNSLISSTYENLELMLISLNESGCADTAVHFYDLYFKGLFIPTAFSPNNPSEAVRVFKPIGVNLQTFNIEIYSSWGNLIWSSSALDENGRPTESWDGSLNGSPLPTGLYVWKASGVFKDGSIWKGNPVEGGEGTTSGTVLLIR